MMIQSDGTRLIAPFLLSPALHVLVWGGRKFATHLDKPLPTDARHGEAWELHDTATVEGGALDGRTIADLVATFGSDLIGADADPADGMPLLIKFLDANDWLSVQVHPDDADCRTMEGLPRGKNEAWYVVDAEADAALINGVQDGATIDRIGSAIAANTLAPLLHHVPVRAGDALYMKAGTIHALGPGLLIYEVQQSCNVTYRLYDWGRMGLDGQPRPLHIDKALRVADPRLCAEVTHADTAVSVSVFDTPHFITVRHTLTDTALPIETDGRFHAITVLDGAMTVTTDVGSVAVPRGRTAFVPACIDQFTLSGSGTALRSAQPAHAR